MELSEQTQIKLIEDVSAIKQMVLDMKEANKDVCELLKTHDGRIKELEAYKNNMVGRLSIIAMICGVVGWAVSTGVSYILNNIKGG